MGLIDFLEGAYKGGRLLFLLYDHDKQVKLRYKAIKGSGIKRLHSSSGVIASERIKLSEKRDLVKQQSRYSTRDILEDEIKSSLAQGFDVTVRNNYISVWCFKTGSTEWMHITDSVEEPAKLYMINQMKDNLIKRRDYLNKPMVDSISKRKSALDEEIELCSNLGYYVDVYTPTNKANPVEISVYRLGESIETGYLYYPYTSTADKVKKIRRLRHKLRESIREENSPKPYYELPRNSQIVYS